MTISETPTFEFGNFLQYFSSKIYQNQNSKLLKIIKMADFDTLKSPKIISRKICHNSDMISFFQNGFKVLHFNFTFDNF